MRRADHAPLSDEQTFLASTSRGNHLLRLTSAKTMRTLIAVNVVVGGADLTRPWCPSAASFSRVTRFFFTPVVERCFSLAKTDVERSFPVERALLYTQTHTIHRLLSSRPSHKRRLMMNDEIFPLR